MNHEGVVHLPTVVVGLEANRGILVETASAPEPVEGPFGTAIRFVGREVPTERAIHFSVEFSAPLGTGMDFRSGGLYPTSLDAFDLQGKLTTCALAALGEHLEEQAIGQARVDWSTYPTVTVGLFRTEGWAVRSPASESTIFRFLDAHSVAAWRSGIGSFKVGVDSSVRLATSLTRLADIAAVYDGETWSVDDSKGPGFSLRSTNQRLRSVVASTPSTPSATQALTSKYVSEGRIQGLRDLSRQAGWDTARLVAMLEELNRAAPVGSWHTIALLQRAIIDHVPPLFGHKTFAQVVANYAGGRSFKKAMEQLERVRPIADESVHSHIRRRERLLTDVQVNFASGLDRLLAEVEVLLKDAAESRATKT